MPEELVVLHCSPTMAGIKTASLFTCPLEDKAEMVESLKKLNAKLVPKGVRIIPIKYMEHRVLVYMYRPERLNKDLKHPVTRRILQGMGYPVTDVTQCVAMLKERVNLESTFPHEIGLFLGYPPDDVKAFIENQARDAILVGTWKVYHNEEDARRTFAKFETCTKTYCEYFRRFQQFDKLIVKCS